MAWQITGIPWIAEHPWAYPALEVVHTSGIALLLGSLVVLELRVWGAVRELPLAALARLALPVTATGFALVLASGLLMFAAQPGEFLAHRLFLLKMGLVFAAGVNAPAFHARGSLARADRTARAQTLLSTGLWLGAIICGRFIAYV